MPQLDKLYYTRKDFLYVNIFWLLFLEFRNGGGLMKFVFFSLFAFMFFAGCSATWHGVKEDTSHSVEWTKEQVNHGAAYIKEKTE